MLALEVLKPPRCAACGAILPSEVLEAPEMAMCPACNADTMVRVFPAILNAPEIVSPEGVVQGEQEAACFFHPSKAAAIACSRCGRFLCQLCQVEFRGESWCPECITTGARKKKIATLENCRTLYDTIALALAGLPIPFFWFATFLTAPAALFMAIRYWRAPGSLVRRTKLRLIVAISLALCEIAGWAWFIVYLVIAARMAK